MTIGLLYPIFALLFIFSTFSYAEDKAQLEKIDKEVFEIMEALK